MHTFRNLLFASAVLAAPLFAEEAPRPNLPDSPGVSYLRQAPAEATSSSSSAAFPFLSGKPVPPVAPRWATTIKEGQTAQPLKDLDKPILALHQIFAVKTPVSAIISASWAQARDSSPHFGTDSGAYGERLGAAVVRRTSQKLFTTGFFAPIFHDDPRYYVLGHQKTFTNRAVYAATRVLITRSNSGNARPNIPLLAGYLGAAGLNNAYYPHRDRTLERTFYSYGNSVAGAALGYEVSEFMPDVLRWLHLKKN